MNENIWVKPDLCFFYFRTELRVEPIRIGNRHIFLIGNGLYEMGKIAFQCDTPSWKKSVNVKLEAQSKNITRKRKKNTHE